MIGVAIYDGTSSVLYLAKGKIGTGLLGLSHDTLGVASSVFVVAFSLLAFLELDLSYVIWNLF